MEDLKETARIGFMGDFEVFIYTDDSVHVPHFHVVDKMARGKEFNSCVVLENSQYLFHGNHSDELNPPQRKMLNDFMQMPCRNVHYRNNYEYAVDMWNMNNDEGCAIPKHDESGDVVVPNYSEIVGCTNTI
jgi:hypothetical protein